MFFVKEFPIGSYLFNFNNENKRAIWEIYLKLIIISFKQISDDVLKFPFLTLSKQIEAILMQKMSKLDV